MENKSILVFRCSASSTVGMGHLMRCIAISQELRKKEIEILFILTHISNKIKLVLDFHKLKYFSLNKDFNRDLEITKDVCKDHNCRNIVIDISNKETILNKDIYENYFKSLIDEGFRLYIIDGTGKENICIKYKLFSQVIILPYLISDKEKSKFSKFKNSIISQKYFPIREELKILKRKEVYNKKRIVNILVFLSGASNENHINKILKSFELFEDYSLNLISIGGSYKNLKSIHKFKNLDNNNNFSNLINWADLAIIGSGLIRYELAYLQIPSVTFSLKKDHIRFVEHFCEFKTSLYGGYIKDLNLRGINTIFLKALKTKKIFNFYSDPSNNFIDGKGAERIVNLIMQNY